jgi:hypothetical protein
MITKEDLARIKDRTRLTSKEMGEAVGYSDAERTVRALLLGERHGRAYAMSGTAAKSLTYLLALYRLVEALRTYQVDQNPTTEAALAMALDEATGALPQRMQDGLAK